MDCGSRTGVARKPADKSLIVWSGAVCSNAKRIDEMAEDAGTEEGKEIYLKQD